MLFRSLIIYHRKNQYYQHPDFRKFIRIGHDSRSQKGNNFGKIPGPGAYNPKKHNKQESPSFGFRIKYSQTKQHSDSIPGPGKYDPKIENTRNRISSLFEFN